MESCMPGSGNKAFSKISAKLRTTWLPIATETPLHVCPKIEASPARKQKKSSSTKGTEDKENTPLKVARSTLVSTEKHDDVTDTDQDLVTQLEQDKKLSPRKVPFGNSPSRGNKPATRSLKGNSRKQHYDPITAQNMRKERSHISGIKHEPQEDAVQFGCWVLWHVKSFDDESLAREEIKAATWHGRMQHKRPCNGANNWDQISSTVSPGSLKAHQWFVLCIIHT